MAWLFLLTAGSLEIAWILGLKYSEGFTRFWPSVLTLAAIAASFTKAAQATCDFYIENSALDGIPYWDTGAPQLHTLGDWRARPADS